MNSLLSRTHHAFSPRSADKVFPDAKRADAGLPSIRCNYSIASHEVLFGSKALWVPVPHHIVFFFLELSGIAYSMMEDDAGR